MILLWSLMLFHFCVLSHCPENLHHLFRTIILSYQLSNRDHITNISSLVPYCFSYYMSNFQHRQYFDSRCCSSVYDDRCNRRNLDWEGFDNLVISLQAANTFAPLILKSYCLRISARGLLFSTYWPEASQI